MPEHIPFSQQITEISLEELADLETSGVKLRQAGLPVILDRDSIFFLHILHLSRGAGPGINGLQEGDFYYYADKFQRKGMPIREDGSLPGYYIVGEEESWRRNQMYSAVVFYERTS